MRANAKIDEAKAKRAEYDEEKKRMEGAARSAVEASRTLSHAGDQKSALLKEKENTKVQVEKIETKLVQVKELACLTATCEFQASRLV